MGRIDTDINYHYEGVNGNSRQLNLEIDNLQVAQVSKNIVFARRVTVGVVGIGAMAVGYTAYNNPEILVNGIRTLGDYNIGSRLMTYGDELSTALAGMVSYATLFNAGPEALNVICHMAKLLKAIGIVVPFSVLRTLVNMTIEGVLYDGPTMVNIGLKFVNIVCSVVKALLKGLRIVTPYVFNALVRLVSECVHSLIDIIKLAYEWRGTVGMAVIVAVIGRYDPEKVVDLLQWVYEQYENFSKFSHTFDWTTRVALQAVVMTIAWLVGGEGVESIIDGYKKTIEILSLIWRYEYAPPYRGMLSVLGIIGVVLYYDLELAFILCEEMYEYSELAVNEITELVF